MARPPPRSILFSQHDRENARGLCRVGGVFRAELTSRVVIVDLPENALAVVVEAPEIMLTVGVVVVGEAVESANLIKDRGAVVVAESKDSVRDVASAIGRKVPPESVVEFADFRRGIECRRHGVRALFNLDDYDTAKYWSDFVGGRLVESRSHQEDKYGFSKGENVGETMRPLLSPDEIMLQFGADRMLVLPQGQHPFATKRVPYWNDASLNGLWDDPRVPVPRVARPAPTPRPAAPPGNPPPSAPDDRPPPTPPRPVAPSPVAPAARPFAAKPVLDIKRMRAKPETPAPAPAARSETPAAPPRAVESVPKLPPFEEMFPDLIKPDGKEAPAATPPRDPVEALEEELARQFGRRDGGQERE